MKITLNVFKGMNLMCSITLMKEETFSCKSHRMRDVNISTYVEFYAGCGYISLKASRRDLQQMYVWFIFPHRLRFCFLFVNIYHVSDVCVYFNSRRQNRLHESTCISVKSTQLIKENFMNFQYQLFRVSHRSIY